MCLPPDARNFECALHRDFTMNLPSVPEIQSLQGILFGKFRA